jgi:hypothetical protein
MKIPLNLLMSAFAKFGPSLKSAPVTLVPSQKSQRSPELVAVLVDKAERKRARKRVKRAINHAKCISNNPCLN